MCEAWSIDGLSESITRLDAVQRSRVVRVAGIIPTLYRASTLEHQDKLDMLRERFGDYVWPEIPQRTVWPESAAYQRPVFLHAPDSDAAGHAWEVVDRVEQLGVNNGE